MKKILASIITYNPDIVILKKNINSYIEFVDEIIIVDNGSTNLDQIEWIVSQKIKLIRNNENLGIAHALNIALDYAHRCDYHLLLTMDQDSYFMKNSFLHLIDGLNKYRNVAIVCPSLNDLNSGNVDSVDEEFKNILTTITSGCLCSVEIFRKVGGFTNKLFIDYVDVEISLRLKKNGYMILRSKQSILNHSLGESKIYHLLGLKWISTNHSPSRRFYYSRNKIYIYKNFIRDFPAFVMRDFLSFSKTVIIIIVFEKGKIKKLSSILRGVYHGLFVI